mmetsp:Transcript_144877/g.255370  ORF Transcript_144877/g.255370 Transcript_144877/m.255370 type:complete len:285 (-) Transcript_144877:77-931(-)
MISASIVQHILLFFVTTAQGHALHNRHVEDQGLQEQRLDGQHFLGQEPGEVEKTTTQLFMTSSRGTVKATSSIAVTTSAMPTMPNTTTLDELSDWELARQKYLAQTTTEPPPKKIAEASWKSTWLSRAFAQLAFGVIYYLCIVRHYPKLQSRNTETIEALALREKGPLAAACSASGASLFHAFCCSGPRAAHTFDRVGIMNYWLGFITMTALPCCTLCAVETCTGLTTKLGGKPRSLLANCFLSCLCSCCVIVQDADSLDLIMNVETGLFSIQNNLEALNHRAF